MKARTPVIRVARGANHPFRIGRGGFNDLVVLDAGVSWNHAAVWVEQGELVVEDLGSLNGTWLGEARATPFARAGGSELLRLGLSEPICVAAVEPPPGVHLIVLREGSTLATPWDGRPLDLSTLADGARGALQSDETGLSLCDDGAVDPIQVGEIFDAGLVAFRVLPAPDRSATALVAADPLERTRLVVHKSRHAVEVHLVDPGTGAARAFRGDIPAALLNVLARRLVADAARNLPRSEQGWTANDLAIREVWGKPTWTLPNNLNVTVHRLRRDLEASGFSPHLIERRRGWIRLALAPENVEGD